MKILVCGGRGYDDYLKLCEELNKLYDEGVEVVIHGGAKGADSLAGRWARDTNTQVKVCKPDWEKYGKSAGILRNIQMLEEETPDLVVAFPGGKGTAHMVSIARKKGVKVIEVTCN